MTWTFFLAHQIGISVVLTHVSHIPVPAPGKDLMMSPFRISPNSGFSFFSIQNAVLSGEQFRMRMGYRIPANSASLVMQIGYPLDEFFYPILTLLVDPYKPRK